MPTILFKMVTKLFKMAANFFQNSRTIIQNYKMTSEIFKMTAVPLVFPDKFHHEDMGWHYRLFFHTADQ